MRNPSSSYDGLPLLWRLFLWYAPMLPVIHLTLPLVEQSTNHMIWISAIIIFLVLFAPVIVGTTIRDFIVALLYVAAVVLESQNVVFDKLGVMLFVSAALYFVFLIQYSIPDAMERYWSKHS